MLVVDIKVVSELVRAAPAPVVLPWVRRTGRRELYFSAVGEAQQGAGTALLPDGRRCHRPVAAIYSIIADGLAGRVRPFDSPAAEAHARIAADR